jgi:Tfp pilus assembly protein PilV
MNNKHKRQSGVTVIEVMIVVAVLFFILMVILIVFGRVSGCMFADTQRTNAVTEAHQWVHEMYPEVRSENVHIVCQGQDTDGNGYVTCSARVGEEHLNLECYAYVAMNIGDNTCREVTILQGGRPGRR